VPAQEAFVRGWMPLKATGVEEFLRRHPSYDGRGVLIGVLDSGIDAGIPGLTSTSTGQRKVLDLRDFSGEGAIALSPIVPDGDHVRIGSRALGGMSRLRSLGVGKAVYGGSIAELSLSTMPAADLNGDGDDTDTLGVVVVRARDGWVLFADTDGDGSLANEKPVHDYLQAKETFGWRSGRRPPPLSIAANFVEAGGEPRLDLYFDTSGHGSHVAGIAAGNDLYGVAGFDGVAPGAQILGLKIANDAQGEISTSGSMIAGIRYAIRFARDRRLPLVLNMSFGVGNEAEGRARIDSLVDSVLAANPDVVFTISAGNDGPGLSTMGFPGSATRALSVGATFPAVFLGGTPKGGDPVAYFSARGAQLSKPDIVTPGLAFSTVPRWNTGEEWKSGTSMAAPHAAGLAALLLSGLVQESRSIEARQVRHALMVTARPLANATFLDDGTGAPDVGAAWRWLTRAGPVPEMSVRALRHGVTAAYQERTLGTPVDTAPAFEVALPRGAPETDVTLRSSADWLVAPAQARLRAGANTVSLAYVRAAFRRPGVYSGVVSGWTSDTVIGPVFRLVNTVVVADTGQTVVARLGRIPAGGNGRVFFEARPGRPFSVTITTGAPAEQVLAYLHEPGGQPFREEGGIGAGFGEQAGSFVVDGRDAVGGLYEAVAVAPPLDGATATVTIQQSPVILEASRDRDGVALRLANLGPQAISTDPFAVLVGAERVIRVIAHGSEAHRFRFPVPTWAVHAAVDVEMDRDQWPAFTDFGVTLLGPDGRQIGKAPLNYAFGRLHADLRGPDIHGSAEVALFPGFADPVEERRWTANVSIRLYTDSAHVARLTGRSVTMQPGETALVNLPMPATGLPLGDAFFPLGIVVVPEGNRFWTREVPLPAPVTPLSP
jgi:subtilisin family serine protease